MRSDRLGRLRLGTICQHDPSDLRNQEDSETLALVDKVYPEEC